MLPTSCTIQGCKPHGQALVVASKAAQVVPKAEGANTESNMEALPASLDPEAVPDHMQLCEDAVALNC